MKLLISIISLAGILSSVGQESATYSNKEEVVPTGEAAWRALEFNISKHHGWRIDDCVKLFEADTDEFLSKKLIEEIDSEIVENRTGRLYHDKGLLYIEVASRFASHKPHVEEYLFKIAVSDDALMRKGQKTHSEIPAGRSLSSIILLHVGLNMHPDAYNSLNKLWNALDHHEENKRTYYFSLCSRGGL